MQKWPSAPRQTKVSLCCSGVPSEERHCPLELCGIPVQPQPGDRYPASAPHKKRPWVFNDPHCSASRRETGGVVVGGGDAWTGTGWLCVGWWWWWWWWCFSQSCSNWDSFLKQKKNQLLLSFSLHVVKILEPQITNVFPILWNFTF